ncbi:MAG: hypothetical protein HKL84_05290 [Acidimicrobiaceae bacterium]|nr:hypothetical protein [Acidimicrobiaceae bacterium]
MHNFKSLLQDPATFEANKVQSNASALVRTSTMLQHLAFDVLGVLPTSAMSSHDDDDEQQQQVNVCSHRW